MSNSRRELLMAFGDYREHIEYDSGTDTLWTVTSQECDGIVAEAKRISEEVPKKDFRHCAKIPQYVVDQAFRQGWFHDKKKWKDWANNPDNAAFRTWKGRL